MGKIKLTPNIAKTHKLMRLAKDNGGTLISMATLSLNLLNDPSTKVAKSPQKAIDLLFLANCCIHRVFELAAEPTKAPRRQKAA